MSYQAGDAYWRYPMLGEEEPERSDSEVHLLTVAGICIRGHWKRNDPFLLAWSPFPKRDKEKEALILKLKAQVKT